MNSVATNPHSLPAVLFRERVLDDAGEPLVDTPENWELADSKKPDLIELGRGQLQILEIDVLGLLDDVMLHPVEEGDITIRAVFFPAPGGSEPRMGDLLTVAVPDAGAITYEIVVTNGELPDRLQQPGEMCLVLRADLSLV